MSEESFSSISGTVKRELPVNMKPFAILNGISDVAIAALFRIYDSSSLMKSAAKKF